MKQWYALFVSLYSYGVRLRFKCLWKNSLTNVIRMLTHFPLVPHTNRAGIGLDSGLSPIRRQAIIWINAALLSIGPVERNVSKIRIEIQNFSITKMYLKMSSGKWRPFCLGKNVSLFSQQCICWWLSIRRTLSIAQVALGYQQTQCYLYVFSY